MGEAEKTRVGVRDLRGHLDFYLNQARQGTSFLVMSHGEVVAELRPPEPAEQPHEQTQWRRRQSRSEADLDAPPT